MSLLLEDCIQCWQGAKLSFHLRCIHIHRLNRFAAVNLESRRLEWDAQGMEMASNQEKSKRSRRVLADQTKGPRFVLYPLTGTSMLDVCEPSEFRAAAAEEKVGRVGSLLKTYQGEIDRQSCSDLHRSCHDCFPCSLTTRAKLAESAFLGIYKHMLEV